MDVRPPQGPPQAASPPFQTGRLKHPLQQYRFPGSFLAPETLYNSAASSNLVHRSDATVGGSANIE